MFIYQFTEEQFTAAKAECEAQSIAYQVVSEERFEIAFEQESDLEAVATKVCVG